MFQFPIDKVLMPQSKISDAAPLFGFEYEGSLYHVMLFDFGDEGGALGIVRDGDNFCARINVASLAMFNQYASATHTQGQG